MLKKLLKYDLKRVYKNLIVFYSLSIFFSILTRIFLNIPNSTMMLIIGKICSGVTISMFFNIIINNLLRLWVTFTSNLYGDESYLTHTLPVTKNELYLSKFLTAIISVLTSTIVIALSLFIAYYSKDNIELLKVFFTTIANMYDSNITTIIIIFLVLLFLELTTGIQAGYSGIIIGHTKNNNKVVLSIVFGFIIYIATQLLLLLFVYLVALFNPDVMHIFTTNDLPNINTIKLLMYLSIFIYTSFLVIYYFINTHLLNKGVNID